MAYFADLTPYTYIDHLPEQALNVGWLDKDHPYEQGDVPHELVTKLFALASRPVNLMRGSHSCEFCILGDAKRRFGSEIRHLGNGEIRVEHGSMRYAAPVLIAHYVEVHRYRPPQAFIDAVMETTCP